MNKDPNSVNGSDLLFSIDGKAIGHATNHEATFNAETKTVGFKPAASEPKSAANLFKKVTVTGLSCQIKSDSLVVYAEAECGIKEILAKWKTGESVEVHGFERESDEAPYVSGQFIIKSCVVKAQTNEDATLSITLENNGAINVDETKIAITAA